MCLCTCMCMHVQAPCTCHGIHVKAGGQLVGITSFSHPTRWFLGLKSHHLAWQQAPSLNKPSHYHTSLFTFIYLYAHVWVHMWHGAHIVVRRQLTRVGSLLLPCGTSKKLRSSVLVESSFTHWVIFCLPADSLNPHFWNKVSNWNIGLAPAIHLSPLPSTGIVSAVG